MDKQTIAAEGDQGRKAPYTSPTFQVHGTLAQLTASLGKAGEARAPRIESRWNRTGAW